MMARKDLANALSGEIFEEGIELSLADLCRACRLPAERVLEFVEEGIVEPVGQDSAQWRFQSVSIKRVRCALHLERDLGVNTAGAALALDLLEELERMRERLRRLDR